MYAFACCSNSLDWNFFWLKQISYLNIYMCKDMYKYLYVASEDMKKADLSGPASYYWVFVTASGSRLPASPDQTNR